MTAIVRNDIPCFDEFLLESHPSRFLREANKDQQTYNEIHRAMIQWDRCCLDSLAAGFNPRRRKAALRCLRMHSNAILAQSQYDHSHDNYKQANFTQHFWGYVLYQPDCILEHPIEIISIGVHPDCRRQLAATRLLYHLSLRAPRRNYVLYVPEACIDLCALLTKHHCHCERVLRSHHEDEYESCKHMWKFSWSGILPLLNADDACARGEAARKKSAAEKIL